MKDWAKQCGLLLEVPKQAHEPGPRVPVVLPHGGSLVSGVEGRQSR